MQVLRAAALSRAGRREWVQGRERKPCSDGVSSLSLEKKSFKARLRKNIFGYTPYFAFAAKRAI